MEHNLKELLLKDLCARLPYMPKIRIIYQQQGIKGTDEGNVSCNTIERIVNDLHNGIITDMQIYLRPLSSMTEEENKEFFSIWTGSIRGDMIAKIDFYIKHHFDFRLTSEGLSMIEAGLALEAPEGMYNIKEK